MANRSSGGSSPAVATATTAADINNFMAFFGDEPGETAAGSSATVLPVRRARTADAAASCSAAAGAVVTATHCIRMAEMLVAVAFFGKGGTGASALTTDGTAAVAGNGGSSGLFGNGGDGGAGGSESTNVGSDGNPG